MSDFNNSLPNVYAIVGPTATGKSAYAVALAKRIGGEVVSADSRQVYTGLDIGTGKITPAEMDGVPHHMIDIVDPEVRYTVADYVPAARTAIADILASGKVPIIAGGTGMYIDALVGRIGLNTVKPNPTLRARLEALPLAQLQEELARLDPVRFESVDQKNPRRLIRALEIAHQAGSADAAPTQMQYQVTWVGLTYPREVLKERIVKRLHERLAAGMLQEARVLHEQGLSYERMDELGLEYRYEARHLQGLITHNEMVASLELEIYKYAKRQMTWFKKNPEIEWVPNS